MGTSRGQLVEEIADLLPAIMRCLFAGRGESAPHLDITVGELRCLATIGHLGKPSMTDLSDRLYLQPSTVTGLVDALVDRGLVDRYADPEDRRVVRVGLTPEGRRRRAQHRTAKRRRLMAALADVNSDELRSIRAALHTLHAAALRAAETRERADGPAEEENE
ncbi:MAG: MarR family winged helix-turn-helix transcriptional regulator [Armatimonadota bacterium]